MGDFLFDKIKEATKSATDKVGDSFKKMKGDMAQYKAESDTLKAPVEGAIIRYEVTYNGGLPQYPKEKVGAIGLNIMQDSFILKKTIGTKDWFEDVEIPYDSIQAFSITKRQAGTWEMMLSNDSASARATEVENVLAITFVDPDGTELLLRLEMLTGTTVYNQAKKCQELLDVLRQNKILPRLNKEATPEKATVSASDEIKKFKELLETGVITEAEFEAK